MRRFVGGHSCASITLNAQKDVQIILSVLPSGPTSKNLDEFAVSMIQKFHTDTQTPVTEEFLQQMAAMVRVRHFSS